MKILVIQTAFLGDVILSTAILEQLHNAMPEAELHVLVRKGNEVVLEEHPFVKRVWVWNKKEGKYRNLLKMGLRLRKEGFDETINLQRFMSSGLLAVMSGGRISGYSKNPLSFLFSRSIAHSIGDGTHEVQRNSRLIGHFTSVMDHANPAIYPTKEDFEKIAHYAKVSPYYLIAPASVWPTKQYPLGGWKDLINRLEGKPIFLVGAPDDAGLCEDIISGVNSREKILNLCGKLSVLQTAALMKNAKRVFCNDSAPTHLASAVNAPVTTAFCSTIPEFGFGPLSDDAKIAQTNENLSCRPCGLHGKKKCPEGHFNCSKFSIPLEGD